MAEKPAKAAVWLDGSHTMKKGTVTSTFIVVVTNVAALVLILKLSIGYYRIIDASGPGRREITPHISKYPEMMEGRIKILEQYLDLINYLAMPTLGVALVNSTIVLLWCVMSRSRNVK